MRSPPSLSTTLAAVMMLLLPLLSAARVHDDVCGGQEGQVCLGCNMVAVCLRLDGVNVTVAASALCPEGTQYCLNGTCVADMSPENDCGVEPTPSAKATSPFRCPAGFSGYLPDACDCSRYHYCQDGEGWDLACNVQPSTVYQHANAACVPAWQTPCAAAADCPADANRTYSLYGQDNTVAFRCERGVVDVLLCPANHRLDLEAAVDGQDPPCVRFCPRSGRQAVDRDDTLYYECLELGAGRTGHPVLTACPEGTRFDASLERCLLVASNVNY